MGAARFSCVHTEPRCSYRTSVELRHKERCKVELIPSIIICYPQLGHKKAIGLYFNFDDEDNDNKWILLGSKVFKRNGQSFNLGGWNDCRFLLKTSNIQLSSLSTSPNAHLPKMSTATWIACSTLFVRSTWSERQTSSLSFMIM